MAPVYKADQIRKIFKRHYDWTGRVFPWWVKAKSVFTDEELEELKDRTKKASATEALYTMSVEMALEWVLEKREELL